MSLGPAIPCQEVQHSKETNRIYFTTIPTAELKCQFRISLTITKFNPQMNSGITQKYRKLRCTSRPGTPVDFIIFSSKFLDLYLLYRSTPKHYVGYFDVPFNVSSLYISCQKLRIIKSYHNSKFILVLSFYINPCTNLLNIFTNHKFYVGNIGSLLMLH